MKKKDLNPNVIEDAKTETKRRIKANMMTSWPRQ